MTTTNLAGKSIAVLMPGDMGHAVGRVLREHGARIISCLKGRSDHTRQLASSAGFEDAGSLDELVSEADTILSILPPAQAEAQARDVAGAMRRTNRVPVYVDCNAIAPSTVQHIELIMSDEGARLIDAGIIGLAPGKGPATRFYVSGSDVSAMTALDGTGIDVIEMGPRIGAASALKMTYAGLTKGTWTLHTAVLLAAHQMGVLPQLLSEFEFSQKPALAAMRQRTPRLPADSGRWIGEMEEIGRSFADVNVPSGFHQGAAEIFTILAETPFAVETRDSIDDSRTLEQALEEFAKHLGSPGRK